MLRRRVPVILQSEAPECGIACLAMIASFHGHRTDLAAMRLRMSPSLKGVTMLHLRQLAESMHMAARGVRVEDVRELGKLTLPAILHWDMNHFVVLTKVTRGGITVHDPARGRRQLAWAEASKHYTGVAMELSPAPGFRKADEREKLHLWQFWASLAGLRGAIAQLLILSLALEIFAISAPFFLQITVDRVLVGRDRDVLTVLGLAFLALVIIQASVTSLRAWVGVYLSTHLNLRLTSALFAHLIRLPLAWFEKRHIGDIVSKFQSVDAIQRTLSTTFVETAIDGLMVILTLAVMFYYSATLTLVVLGAALVYGLTRWLFYYPQRLATDEQLAHDAKSRTHFIETLRGMPAIKLHGRENERKAAWQNLVVDHTNAGVRVQNVGIAHRSANALVFGVENVLVIWLAALAVLDGRFTVGMLYAFLGFKLVFLTRVNNLIEKLIEFRMLDLHAERIGDIALADTEAVRPQMPMGAERPALFTLEARNLGYAYGPEGFVFRGLDLTMAQGEMVAIVGPSGCGKTTLVKVLVGLLTPSEGEIRVNGRDLRELDLAQYRRSLGAVMQEDQLFMGTIEDNISFFDPEHDTERAKECARIAQIHDEVMAMPMQYNTLVGSLGSVLSGGQKQRILLARALYRRPKILFVDEAIDQVDLERERKILSAVRGQGVGVVLVSHRPDTVASFERVIELAGMPAPRAPLGVAANP